MKPNDRDELIKDLVAIMTEKPYMEPTVTTAGVIADFILADRKRIVAIASDIISRIEDNRNLGVYTNEEWIIAQLEAIKTQRGVNNETKTKEGC